MATIDELIVKFRFDVDEKGLRRLQSLEDMTENAGSSAEKMGKGFDSASKNIKHSVKSTDALAASFTRVALAAASALTIGKAMRFTLGAADEAREITDLATTLGESASELQIFGAAMRSAGRDSTAFFSDFKKLNNDYGGFTLEDVYTDANKLKTLREDLERQGKNAMPIVLAEAAAMGYGEQSALWIMQGEDAIKGQMEQSRRDGQGISDEQVKKGKEAADAYSRLSETLSGISKSFAYDLSPAITKGMDAISQTLSENQNAIDSWAKAANDSISLFVEAMTSDLGNASNEISKFNGVISKENARDPDPEVRRKNYSELQGKAFWQAVKTNTGALWDTTGTILSGGYDFGYNVFSGEIGKAADSVTDTFDRLYGIGDNLLSDYSKITAPLKDAQRGDLESRYDSNTLRLLEQLEQRYNANPELREQAYERSRQEVMVHYDQLQNKPTFSSLFEAKPKTYATIEEAKQAYEASIPSLQNIPVYPTADDQNLLDGLRDVMSRWGPPSPSISAAMPGITPSDSMGDGGVTVQHQEVTINIDGGGQNPEAIGNVTLLKLRDAARMSDFGPRMR